MPKAKRPFPRPCDHCGAELANTVNAGKHWRDNPACNAARPEKDQRSSVTNAEYNARVAREARRIAEEKVGHSLPPRAAERNAAARGAAPARRRRATRSDKGIRRGPKEARERTPFCTNCGGTVGRSWNYCGHCGQRLGGREA